MNYKVRKMTVWQRLYLMDAHLKFKDQPFAILGIILQHGLTEMEGLELKETEMNIMGDKKCKVLTDESVAMLLDKYGLNMSIWDSIIQSIYRENLLPFTENIEKKEPG